MGWPTCTVGCVDLPVIDGFLPVEDKPLLPDQSFEYKCAISSLIPHSGKNIVINCLKNGTFDVVSEIPVCVPKKTCREPIFPTHPNYVVANPKKVSYLNGESIEMACKDTDLVSEPKELRNSGYSVSSFTKETFSIRYDLSVLR